MAKHFINSLSKCWRSCFFAWIDGLFFFHSLCLFCTCYDKKPIKFDFFSLAHFFLQWFFLLAFILGHIWYLIRILDIPFKRAGKDMRYLSSQSWLGGICINCNNHTMEHIRFKRELNVNQWQQWCSPRQKEEFSAVFSIHLCSVIFWIELFIQLVTTTAFS